MNEEQLETFNQYKDMPDDAVLVLTGDKQLYWTTEEEIDGVELNEQSEDDLLIIYKLYLKDLSEENAEEEIKKINVLLK